MSNEIKKTATESEMVADTVATNFDLNMHMARLLISEPFFAALSRRINKIKTTAIPTAGVCVNVNTHQFELFYNPEFMESLSDEHKIGVLKHEFYHLIFDHVTGRKPADPKMFRLWNFATDMAINSHLRNELPEMCVMPGKNQFADYIPGLAAEVYFEALKKDVEKNKQDQQNGENGQSGKGQSGDGVPSEGQFDSHDGWNNENGAASDQEAQAAHATGEAAKERLRDILRKAVQESQQGSGWGSVPAACQKEIIERMQTHINWRKILRYFVKTSQRANKSSTPRRINKRYQYIHPGKRINRQANIAICIDQSGSVSDVMLAMFFSELNKLAEIATFTVIPHDSHVDESKIFVWKKGENRKRERVLCGGTDFNPPTEYINKHGFDGAIFLTDLQAPKPKSCKCQRMWMTDVHNANRPYFKTNERIVAIDK
jgi:predicted metal-dependent peptidase